MVTQDSVTGLWPQVQAGLSLPLQLDVVLEPARVVCAAATQERLCFPSAHRGPELACPLSERYLKFQGFGKGLYEAHEQSGSYFTSPPADLSSWPYYSLFPNVEIKAQRLYVTKVKRQTCKKFSNRSNWSGLCSAEENESSHWQNSAFCKARTRKQSNSQKAGGCTSG